MIYNKRMFKFLKTSAVLFLLASLGETQVVPANTVCASTSVLANGKCVDATVKCISPDSVYQSSVQHCCQSFAAGTCYSQEPPVCNNPLNFKNGACTL